MGVYEGIETCSSTFQEGFGDYGDSRGRCVLERLRKFQKV